MADIPEQTNEDDLIHEHQKRDLAESKRARVTSRKKVVEGDAPAEKQAEPERKPPRNKNLADLADKTAAWTRR